MSRPELVPLTPSESRVLALLASGASNDDVALSLNTSATMARDLLKGILNKLSVSTRKEAIAIWRGEHLHDALRAEHERRCRKVA